MRQTRYGRHSQSPAPHADGCLDTPVPIRGKTSARDESRGDDMRLSCHAAALRSEDAGHACPVRVEWRP